jgi:hypothetical protein
MERELTGLVVGMPGVEVDLLVPASLRDEVHVAQPWAPRACHCGSLHEPCDRAWVTLFAGVPQLNVHPHPDARALAATPHALDVTTPIPIVVATIAADFGRWTSELVRNVFEPVVTPGLIGYDCEDLDVILRSTARFQFAYATGADDVVTLARRLTESAPLALGKNANLLLAGRDDLTLVQVNDAADVIQEALHEDASIMFAATASDGAGDVNCVSVLFAR